MPKHFHKIAPAAISSCSAAGVRIALQRMLHLKGEAIHAAAHVGMACRNPHPHP
jgi:hypothetical protein